MKKLLATLVILCLCISTSYAEYFENHGKNITIGAGSLDAIEADDWKTDSRVSFELEGQRYFNNYIGIASGCQVSYATVKNDLGTNNLDIDYITHATVPLILLLRLPIASFLDIYAGAGAAVTVSGMSATFDNTQTSERQRENYYDYDIGLAAEGGIHIYIYSVVIGFTVKYFDAEMIMDTKDTFDGIIDNVSGTSFGANIGFTF